MKLNKIDEVWNGANSLFKWCFQFVVIQKLGWFSNRTGTSFDDGKARGKDWMSSIKRAREVRKYHVAVVQRQLRNVQKAWCTCKLVVLLVLTCYFFSFSLPSPSSLLKLPTVLIIKFCYHGNLTSHFWQTRKCPTIKQHNSIGELAQWDGRGNMTANLVWQAWQQCLQRIFRRTFPSFKHFFFC